MRTRTLGVALAALVVAASPLASATTVGAAPHAGVIARASVPAFPGNLIVGSQGAAVVAVQKGLLSKGYRISGLTTSSSGSRFGFLGAATMATIMRFKASHDLGPSRAVGPKTYAAITGWQSGSSAGASSGSKWSTVRAASPYSWSSPSYAKWYASRRMSAYGWNAAQQMACLRPMWIGESHWQYKEITGQYVGIPQTTIGVANDYGYSESAYRGTPEVQVEVGMRYIRDRYGSPCKAWAFWKAQGAWQDSQDSTQWWGGWY